jgi:hypothetical protein
MEHTLFYFNRRGAVCALSKSVDPEALNKDASVVYRAISPLKAKYFLVMKHISGSHMLVAPVFDAKRKDCKVVRINGKRLWVNFMTFYVVPVHLMEAAPGKYLDYSFKTITGIYTSHNNVLKEKWRREAEARAWDEILRKNSRNFRQQERRRARQEPLVVPSYLQWNAAHPYNGGTMTSR